MLDSRFPNIIRSICGRYSGQRSRNPWLIVLPIYCASIPVSDSVPRSVSITPTFANRYRLSVPCLPCRGSLSRKVSQDQMSRQEYQSSLRRPDPYRRAIRTRPMRDRHLPMAICVHCLRPWVRPTARRGGSLSQHCRPTRATIRHHPSSVSSARSTYHRKNWPATVNARWNSLAPIRLSSLYP